MTFIMTHWQQGGTGVTNFSEHMRPIYVEAVRRFGDANLVVHPHAFAPCKPTYGGSLHCFRMGDLSAFWQVYDHVKEEFENGVIQAPDDPYTAYDRAMKGLKP